MKDNRAFYLTKSEDQVMNILWNAKEPMTQLQILQQAGLPDTRCFKDRSIFAILNGLLSKELVQEVGFVHSEKTFSRTFAPTKSRAEWYANELFHALGKNEMREFRSTLRNLLKGFGRIIIQPSIYESRVILFNR